MMSGSKVGAGVSVSFASCADVFASFSSTQTLIWASKTWLEEQHLRNLFKAVTSSRFLKLDPPVSSSPLMRPKIASQMKNFLAVAISDFKDEIETGDKRQIFVRRIVTISKWNL